MLSLLAVLGLLVLPASAGGAAERYSPLADGPIVIEDTGLRPIIAEYDESITPYLTHLSQASCNLTIEDGAVNFYGMVTMYRNRYSRIILTLQRSANGVTWTDVPDMEWLQIWYTNGAHMLSKSLTDLPADITIGPITKRRHWIPITPCWRPCMCIPTLNIRQYKAAKKMVLCVI